MLVTLIMPPLALLLGWMALGERLTAGALLGMVLIVAGLAAVDARAFGLLRPPRPWRR